MQNFFFCFEGDFVSDFREPLGFDRDGTFRFAALFDANDGELPVLVDLEPTARAEV